jgi:CBS domain-containing protein
MTSPVICVSVHDLLADVEQHLIDARITGVPVVEKHKIAGIITRSDFVRLPILFKAMDGYVADLCHENSLQQLKRTEFSEFRPRFGSLTVAEVMTRQVVTCVSDTPVNTIAAKMIRHHVHRVVVVEENRPIGIVGSLDLVKLLDV